MLVSLTTMEVEQGYNLGVRKDWREAVLEQTWATEPGQELGRLENLQELERSPDQPL